MKDGARLRTNKNIADFRTKQELFVTHELSGLRRADFHRARLRNTRPSSPFELHPHWDEGWVLHFRLEVGLFYRHYVIGSQQDAPIIDVEMAKALYLVSIHRGKSWLLKSIIPQFN